MKPQENRVICAMSGGVDSGIACFLLKQKTPDVTGVYLDLFDSKEFARAKIRAENICKKLDVPFMVLDVRKEFKNKIIHNFIKQIKQGITPNPCVLCNKEMKIDLLLKKLKELKIDFDYIATGHYARKNSQEFLREIQSPKSKLFQNKTQNKKYKIYGLAKAKDKNKDQSYFLWMLGQRELSRVVFPVGNYTKQEVKEIAAKIGIAKFIKRESQDICFAGNNVNEFLKKYIKEKPGKIANRDNKIIGEHQGLFFYTIGQRKSIGLSGGPYYVTDKNIKKNILMVSKNEKDLDKKKLVVKDVNWVSGIEPKLPLRVKAKIRYHHKPAFGVLKYENSRAPRGREKIRLTFDKPQRAITPGQSAVFYSRDNLLGGGIIC